MAICANRLIEQLPRSERGRLLDLCEPVPLVLAAVLGERGAAARAVYFPTSGFISLVTQVDRHPGLEVGMIGREGMLGAQLALGIAIAPLRAVVQGPGQALRIGAVAFQRELARSPVLKRSLDRYLYVLLAQLVRSAGCQRFHAIGPRLARWLLMSQDRAQADRFRVTHEFLSYMLGVRRVGITIAAGDLQRDGVIKYHRGDVMVLDRARLEAAACGCYAEDRRAYAQFLRLDDFRPTRRTARPRPPSAPSREHPRM